MFLQVIQNDQFAIVTSFEFPMFSLLNLKNIYQPFIYQQFLPNINLIGFYRNCIFKDESQIFQLSQYTLFLFQLRSSMVIQTQIYSISSSNEYKVLQKHQSLQVGGNYAVYFVPIYQSKIYKIISQQYYKDFEYQPLPSWMQFIQNENKILLYVAKESLQNDKQGNIIEGYQQIILLTLQQVQVDEFINTYLNISYQDSENIYNACINQGIIDHDGFINQTYSPKKNLNLGSYESIITSKWTQTTQQRNVINFIQFKLNKNIINQVISFTTTPSLVVTMIETTIQIKSINDDIIVVLALLSNSNITKQTTNFSRFVSISYPNILSYFSSTQDQLTMEGKLNYINEILQNGILFYQDQNFLNGTLIEIKVSDSINYDYNKVNQPQNLSFIIPIQQVGIKYLTSLQDDLDLIYPGGQLTVSQTFIYQINSKIFTSNKKLNLSYDITILTEGQLEQIPQNFWLQYRSSDRVLIGTPTLTNFQQNIIISVNVTDGYSFATQQFQISITKIPFNVVLQIIIQVLGPILGLLGFYKYSYILINCINSKQVTYSKETVYTGKQYQKQIVLTENIKQLASVMWEDFLLKQGKKNINTFIKDKFFIHQYDSNCSSQRTNQSLYQNNDQNLLKISKEEQVLIKIINQELKKLQKRGENSQFQKQKCINILDVNGNINLKYILKEIKDQQQIQASQKKYLSLLSSKDLHQLDNSNSLLSMALYSIVVSYISKQDSLISCFQKWLCLIAQKQYKQVDWYKAYLIIKSSHSQVQYHPYPKLEINEESFNSAFSEILQTLGQKQNFQLQNKEYFQFVINILKQSIISSAIGYFDNSYFQKATQGESIHCSKHEIKKIVSYQKVETFTKIPNKDKKVQFTFKKKSLSGNNLLPSWITSVDIIYDVLIIKGLPQKEDTGNILIEVMDNRNIILRKFEISIVNQELCNPVHFHFSKQTKNQNTQLLKTVKSPFHSERQIKNRDIDLYLENPQNHQLLSAKIIRQSEISQNKNQINDNDNQQLLTKI